MVSVLFVHKNLFQREKFVLLKKMRKKTKKKTKKPQKTQI